VKHDFLSIASHYPDNLIKSSSSNRNMPEINEIWDRRQQLI